MTKLLELTALSGKETALLVLCICSPSEIYKILNIDIYVYFYALSVCSCTDVKTKMHTKENSSLQRDIQKKKQEMKNQGTPFSF